MQRPAFGRLHPAWPALAEPWDYWPIFIDGIRDFQAEPAGVLDRGRAVRRQHAAFYTTEALRETLSDLVDFTIVNRGAPRLTVGAANVETSMMCYFDTREMPLAAEHIMASGALPPAFPAINIEGRILLGRRHSFQHADRGDLR